MIDTHSDKELIGELASRHDELIVIRPRASNAKGSKDRIVIFCKTKTADNSYDLYEATELLNDAQVGLMRDCIVKDTEP